MDTITLDQAIDIGYGTLQNIRRKQPPLATYAYPNYEFFNVFFNGNVKSTGDKLRGHITLDKEDQAAHKGFWAKDSLIKKNIQSRYELDWKLASGGMLWNLIEQSINSGPEAIYNVWQSQYDSAVKDLIEEVFDALMTAPKSSTDNDSPYSIFSWLSAGTAATEGFTGYTAVYDDAVDLDDGSKTTFNKGGIASSASSNTDWANYYFDHAGNLDDSFITMLDTACRKLNFRPPTVPRALPMEPSPMQIKFALYSNDPVIKTINAYLRNSDDQAGTRVNNYLTLPVFKGVPIVYCAPLDETRTDIYGTNPIIGLNHNLIYPVILKGWDFKITKRPVSENHNVMSLFMDLVYQVWCNTSPKYAGFLGSQHAASD